MIKKGRRRSKKAIEEQRVKKKEETGYPHAYRVTWVKGRADKVLSIAKIFEEAGAQKGMDPAQKGGGQVGNVGSPPGSL